MKVKSWEEAYRRLRNLIFNGTLRPGEIISENSLAKRLGMSRTPVREAIHRLEQEGLIVPVSNRKKQIFVLTIKDVEEIFDLKEIIESKVARWAAEHHKPEEAEKLRTITANMKKVVLDNNAASQELNDTWLELDKEYHDTLFAMARNQRAKEIIRNLNQQWHRLRLGILAIEGRLEKSVKEHEEIAEAILRGDAAGAEEAMIEHLRNLRRMLLTLMQAFNFPNELRR